MSNDAFLPFALPDTGQEEEAEVIAALRSGWITTGPRTRQFEQRFAEFLEGDVEAIAVNSATAGLHLVLEGLGIGPGDEVITTTLTFTATAEVVRYLGADVVLVDVHDDSLNIDVQAIEEAITSRTKAIVVVHYCGLACDMTAITKIARKHGLRLIEDAAHALPTSWGGRIVGTLDSDATVFSFYANKTMTTGEGGMVVTRNKDLAARMRIMRLHGISRDAFDRFVSRTPAWYYEVVAPGFKYNMTDVAAAIGLQQLLKLPGFLVRRQELAREYFRALSDLPIRMPADAAPGDVHAWHLFVIRLDGAASVDRDTVIRHLADRGIGTSVHYVPLHRHPYWRDRYRLVPESFPVADAAYRSMLSIPLYTRMTASDQARVIEALREVIS